MPLLGASYTEAGVDGMPLVAGTAAGSGVAKPGACPVSTEMAAEASTVPARTLGG